MSGGMPKFEARRWHRPIAQGPVAVSCSTSLVSTLLQLRDLTAKTPAIFVDSRGQISSKLVELINRVRQMFLRLEITALDCALDTTIILLTKAFQISEIASAPEAVFRERVDPESVILVPRTLLSGAERELGAAAGAWEDGIDVPVSWTDAAVLFVWVRSDGRTIVETTRSVEEMDRHVSRIVSPESCHAGAVLLQALLNRQLLPISVIPASDC